MRYNLYLIIFCLFIPEIYANNQACIQINRVTLRGVSNRFLPQVQSIADQCAVGCITGDDLQQLMQRISNYYGNNGYITSLATIPEQDLNNGELIVEVIEGYIEDIDISTEGKRTLFLPISKNQILSLRDIEQTYDHYNRIKNNEVDITIAPGSKQGASKVVIKKKHGKKWSVVTGINNSGTRQKGETQGITKFSLDDLWGYNEQVGFTFQQSLADRTEKYTKAQGMYAAIPIGYNDLSISYNKSIDRTLISSRGINYINRGGSKAHSININRLIHRDGSGKTYLSLGLGKEIYTSHLDDIQINISSYKINKINIGASHQRRSGGGVLSFGTNVTTGVNKSYYQ